MPIKIGESDRLAVDNCSFLLSVLPTPVHFVSFSLLGSGCMIQKSLVYRASNRFSCGRNIDGDHWELAELCNVREE